MKEIGKLYTSALGEKLNYISFHAPTVNRENFRMKSVKNKKSYWRFNLSRYIPSDITSCSLPRHYKTLLPRSQKVKAQKGELQINT